MTGTVQGVGFRPALYRLARAAGLGGWVQNRAGAVQLALEGEPEKIDAFLRELPDNLPPLARLERVELLATQSLETTAPQPFTIVPSAGHEPREVLIPPDLAMCRDCRSEVLDPGNRRYGYPFTTCTRCGPRYTVLAALPYDRQRTTLAVFPLCPQCRREYEDPLDRRFHAESIACPDCGPQVVLKDAQGRAVPGGPLAMARRALAEGQIVAVRGLGGFLLAADARNRETLRRLRARKARPHKPFAVMAPDLEVVRRYCELSPAAAELLSSSAAPIVILDPKPEVVASGSLPLDLLSPDTLTLGVMLPTSPLHLLLAEPLAGDPVPRFDWLVMTSGNSRGEPICLTNAEAERRLQGIADLFLEHDREIHLRNDDSVCVLREDQPQIWRRARGFAPAPLRPPRALTRCVLAMGADLKNAIALGDASGVVLSPHVGDLDTPEALAGLDQVVSSLMRFLGRDPEVVAVDLHPDMQSSQRGRTLAAREGLPVVEVQHHHAHAVACLAEHGHTDGLALVMDGTGLGPDGRLWGAELLWIREDTSWRRIASFVPVPLPGGDAAVRQPARQLVGRWFAAGQSLSPAWLVRLGITREQAETWYQQCRQGINAPLTHAAGRLFDAFAALFGLAPEFMTYEGQPAIRLEAAARRAQGVARPQIPFDCREEYGMLWIDWTPAFAALADPARWQGQEGDWALAVHRAVVAASEEMIAYGREKGAPPRVALSGGVFMNRILNAELVPRLRRRGLEVLVHRDTPPGDGCIALGQAVIAGGGIR